MSAAIRVNGEARETSAATVLDLLLSEDLDPRRRGLAVALNGAVVPRHAWTETRLAPGDAVEIVQPFRGG